MLALFYANTGLKVISANRASPAQVIGPLVREGALEVCLMREHDESVCSMFNLASSCSDLSNPFTVCADHGLKCFGKNNVQMLALVITNRLSLLV